MVRCVPCSIVYSLGNELMFKPGASVVILTLEERPKKKGFFSFWK